MEDEELYDDKFDKLYDILDNDSGKKYKYTQTSGTTEVARNTDFGKSTFDEDFFPNIEWNDDNDENSSSINELITENRATNQLWIAKAGAGIARAGTKALTEIAKMPGVVGGIVAAPFAEEGEGWETAFNNPWIQGINKLNEAINDEALPVYVRKAVKEGNLWDNVSSIDFWATEGADGVGYMASMLAPGALLGKAKLGANLFKGLKATGAMAGKTEKAVEALTKLGITPNNIDLGAQTLANTLFEAGAEAQGAGESYMIEIEQDLIDGKISEEEANLKRAEAMRNAFVSNMAILMGPNAIMSKMIWGKGAQKAGAKLYNESGDLLSNVGKRSTKEKVLDYGGEIAKGSAREGFFEEGMQSVSEEYFVNEAAEGRSSNLFDLIGDLPSAYLDMISEVDGQKAIFLGSFLGSGMQLASDIKSKKASTETSNQLISKLGDLESFNEIFTSSVKNEDGSLNLSKVQEKMKAFQNVEQLSKIYDEAIQRGDNDTVEQLRAFTTGELIKPFIQSGELGMDALQQYIDNSVNITEIAQKEKKDIDTVRQSIMDRAVKLQNDYNSFSEFAPSFITLKNDNANNTDRQIFYDRLASNYVTKKNLQYYYENEIDNADRQYDNLLKDNNVDINKFKINNSYARDVKQNDIRFKQLSDRLKNLNSELESSNKELENFWKESTQQKAFDKQIKDKINLENDLTKQDEVEQSLKDVESATTEEEVNNVKNTSTSADKVVNNAKDTKKANIKAEKDELVRQQNEAAVNDSKLNDEQNDSNLITKNDNIKSLIDNYNENEEIGLDASTLSKLGLDPTIGDSFLVSEKSKDSITLLNINNADTIVLKLDTSLSNKPTTEEITSTEGDNTIAENNANNQVIRKGEKSGSKIISTDEKGKKFTFVNKAYLDYEKTPINKKGKQVGFEVNMGNNSNQAQIDKIEAERQSELNNSSQVKTSTKEYTIETTDGNISTVKVDMYADGSSVVTKSIKGEVYSKERLNKEQSQDKNILLGLTGNVKNEGETEYTMQVVAKVTSEKNIKLKSNKAADKINAKYDARIAELKNNNKGFSNKNWNNALKGYQKVLNGETLTQKEIDFLINHLPINAVIADDVKAPIETLPNTMQSKQVFDLSSRLLRTNIINALLDGASIENINTKIEGQYPGVLTVDGQSNNQILEMHHMKNMSDKEKTKYIKDNIAIINELGLLEFTNGDTRGFHTEGKLKEEAKGKIYMMVPQSNGEKFPLQLNIRNISESEANILADLYEIRLQDEAVSKSTTLEEIENDELKTKIKEFFEQEISIINKGKDITVKDIVDFMIYDNTNNSVSQVRFGGTGRQGERAFIYGNSKQDGKVVKTPAEFERDHFIQWLQNNKRHQINFKPKKNASNKGNIKENDNYLNYLINNKILSTNAVVNKPMFQGYSSIYLDSNNIKYDKKVENNAENISTSPKKVVSLEEVANTIEKKEIDTLKSTKKATDEISNKDVKNIARAMMKNGILKQGKQTDNILDPNKSNKEKYEALKELAQTNNFNVETILTKC